MSRSGCSLASPAVIYRIRSKMIIHAQTRQYGDDSLLFSRQRDSFRFTYDFLL